MIVLLECLPEPWGKPPTNEEQLGPTSVMENLPLVGGHPSTLAPDTLRV